MAQQVFKVKAPDPRKQYKKTPAKRRVRETIEVDEIEHIGMGDGRERVFYLPSGKPIRVYVDGREVKDIEISEGKIVFKDPPRGAISVVMRRKRSILRWIKFIRSRETEKGIESTIVRWGDFLDELKRKLRYRPLSECIQLAEELIGKKLFVLTKERVIYHIRRALFGETVASALGVMDTVESLERDFIKLGRWGLGCPNRCGRFWWFVPYGDGWKPADPAAYLPYTDPETGEVRNGYLNWQDDMSFTCDRCGAKIKLEVGE